ncbi:MAG TPA: TonB-dependent receptor, partial [Opitutaceae bacterium]|nr:TonB-dependent receptor [Opitutaceae bacterium]
SQYWKYNPTYQLQKNDNANPNLYSTNLNIDNPDYRVPNYAADVYGNLNRKTQNRVIVNGVLLRNQTTTLNGKLIGVAGLRYDNVIFNLWDKKASTVGHFVDHAWSPMLGANYKLTPNIALYANRTNSFSPNAQRATAADSSANETSHGYDYGVKCGFFEDRLQFTLGGYYIDRLGISVTEVDAAGNQITTNGGNQNSKGLEFDYTWRVTDNLTLLGGYGHVSSHITFLGNDLDAVGRPGKAIPADNFGIAGKYNFTGMLKGFAVNAGITYTGKNYPDSTSGGLTGKDGFIRANDGRRDIMLPSYTTTDFAMSYQFHQHSPKISHTVRFYVKNVFDRDYLTTLKTPGDRRGFYASYSLNH